MHWRGREDPVEPGSSEASTGAEDRASPPRSASRRHLLRGVGALAAVGAAGTGGYQAYRSTSPRVDPRTVIPLYSDTVAYDGTGTRVLIGEHGVETALHPGTRLTTAVPPESGVAARCEEFRSGTAAWRDRIAAAHPKDPWIPSLADSALQDLWVLSDDLPAPVAAWTPYWRYVWPRDSAFCAVALARIGQVERALGVLEQLQSVQAADGWFEARYLPGTDRSPDDREAQFDGTGLALWAASEVAECAEGAERGAGREVASRLSELISTCDAALLVSTAGGTTLPPTSPDYWEVHERSVTLGIMATTLAGLRAAAALTGSTLSHGAADSFAQLLTGTFGTHGLQRYRRGGGADSALAFLDATGCHDIVPPHQLASLREELARPGGGIAPGASWRDDGISWTPSTSLLGLASARAGQPDAARGILRWIAEHRTAAGSIPEKVLFDGRPAAVAPLAWTAANVLLTLDALTRD